MKKRLFLLATLFLSLMIGIVANAKTDVEFYPFQKGYDDFVFKKDGSGLYKIVYDGELEVYEVDLHGNEIRKTDLVANPGGGFDYDYSYLTIEDGALVRYRKTGYGIYSPSNPESSEVERVILDDENNYVNLDHNALTVDVDDLEGRGITGNYNTLLVVDNNGEQLYGLANNKDGIVLEPGNYTLVSSAGFNGEIGYRGALLLDSQTNTYYTVSRAGDLVEFSSAMLNRFENEIGFMNIANLNVMGTLEGAGVFSYEYNNKLYVFTEEKLIGKYDLDENAHPSGKYFYTDFGNGVGYYAINHNGLKDYYNFNGEAIAKGVDGISIGQPILGELIYIFTEVENNELTISYGFNPLEIEEEVLTIPFEGIEPVAYCASVDEGGINILLYRYINGEETDDTFYMLRIIETEDPVYKILKGANLTYYLKSGKDITIKADGNINLFQELQIDGKTVAKKYYDLEEGSTIVNLKSSYLDTLKAGKHTVTFVYEDGEVSTTLNVSASNPPTVDKIVSIVALFAISLIGVGVICGKIKKGYKRA